MADEENRTEPEAIAPLSGTGGSRRSDPVGRIDIVAADGRPRRNSK
jgi:hypothetical protein